MKTIIAAEKAPTAIGPYSQAVKANGFLFLSGQIPIVPETGEIAGNEIRTQTRQVLENIQAVLSEAGLSVGDIVKTTVFLADMALFADMNAVYSAYFTGGFPARSTIAVQALPQNALVGIECVAAFSSGH